MLMDYYPLVVKRFVPSLEARGLESWKIPSKGTYLKSFKSSCRTQSIARGKEERRNLEVKKKKSDLMLGYIKYAHHCTAELNMAPGLPNLVITHAFE